MLTKGVTIEKLKLCAVSIGLLAWEQEDELQEWGIVFGGLQLMLVIELVSKWSLVVFDPDDDPTRLEMMLRGF